MITFGILAQDVAQAHRESQPDLRAHRDLVDALKFVFDRFLDRDDALVDRVDRAQERVERGDLPEPVGPVTSMMPCGLTMISRMAASSIGENPSLSRLKKDLSARQQTQRNALAVNRRDSGDTDVDFLALDADVDAAVLRQPLLGDVHSGHDLDARNDRGLVALQLRRHRRLVQDAVDAVADAQFVFRRLEMNIRRAIFERFPDDLVDELDDARFLVALGDFLVFADQQFERFVLGQFVERLGADAVILF